MEDEIDAGQVVDNILGE